MDHDREQNRVFTLPETDAQDKEPLTESLRFVVSDSIEDFLAIFDGSGLSTEKVLDQHLEGAMTSRGRFNGK